MNMERFKQNVVLAYREAVTILLEMPIFIEDMTEDYIRKATSEANILNSVIFGEGIQTPVEEVTVKTEEKEEEEEEEEVGIGGLFG
jgi:hypothetical protein